MKKLSAILTAILMSISMVSCSLTDQDTEFLEHLLTYDHEQSAETAVTEPPAAAETEAPRTAAEAAASASTSAAAETTAVPVTEAPAEEVQPAAADRTANHSYLDGVKRGSIIQITSDNPDSLFRKTKYDTWYFYDLYTSAVAGFGKNGQKVNVAAYEGIKAEITDNRYLNVTAAGGCISGDINICYEVPGNDLPYQTFSGSSERVTASADLWDESFINGFYEISCEFSDDGKTDTASIYLFVNCASNDPQDYELFLCNGEQHYNSEDFCKNRERYSELADFLDREGVTPEKALTANRHYPLSAPLSNDDTQYWVDISHTILEGREQQDSVYKALYLHDWMTSHLSYDEYKVKVLKYQRYKDAQGNTYPENYVSKNYTGVCLDFSSIYAIMCREYGIPCVVLSSDTHAWNAVYLNDRWYEVDLTVDTNRIVKGEDTNDITDADKLYSYYGFCRPAINDEIPLTATKYCW